MQISDELQLISQSQRGNEQAFIALIKRYQSSLSNMIRYDIGDMDHAEDVWQETLIQAWQSIGQLRNPKRVRAWLFQIARNRCKDFHRSSQRRDVATEITDLEKLITRSGMHRLYHQPFIDNILEAIEKVPVREANIIRLFYLEGLTIAEIAQQDHLPEGTVKRRLYSARRRIRQYVDSDDIKERDIMHTYKDGAKKQPFPFQRPQIKITPLAMEPVVIDCPELRWWLIIPQMGHKAMSARYSPVNQILTEVTEMSANREVNVHRKEGVEIEIRTWTSETGWLPSHLSIIGRMTEDFGEYLATVEKSATDKQTFYTFKDQGFVGAWGSMDRTLEDTERFLTLPDGSIQQAHSIDSDEGGGAGMFSVNIGSRAFTCMRICELEGPVADHDVPFTEHYVTQEGRTVFGREWCKPGHEHITVNSNTRLTIDGVTFVHWNDQITNIGMGIE